MCVCHVIPPFILDNMVDSTDATAKSSALTTLAVSNKLLGRRDILERVPIDSPSTNTIKADRTIFSAQNAERLPGVIVREEGDLLSDDQDINRAYTKSGYVHEMLKTLFERNSIDGNGLKLDSTVHYGSKYSNAFWDGRQMVYGDGDGKYFGPFTSSLDVVAHEFFHGVIQYEARLVYWDQHGALNESFADIFGVVTKLYTHKLKLSDFNWIIGEDVITDKVNGVGIRSLRDPGSAFDDPVIGKDIQPGHMRDYVITDKDNGGVHINSGIPNRAFYVAVEQLGDYLNPARIWYVALCDKLKSRSNFQDAANLIARTAYEMFGARSPEHRAVKNAWKSVGITVTGL